MSTQPKRIPNFARSEIKLLTALVKKYGDIIGNKKTTGVHNQVKEQTWIKISQEFNSSSGLYRRSSKALRAKYENMKKTLKRKYGENRMNKSVTEGEPGPSKLLKLTKEEKIIEELTSPSTEDLTSSFISDNLVENDLPINAKDSFIMLESEDGPVLDFSDSTKTMNTYTTLSIKKQKLVDKQLEEITLKLEYEKIEHSLRCETLKAKMAQDDVQHKLMCEKAERDKLEQNLRIEALKLDILLKKKNLQ